MTELHDFLQQLRQPEYVHVLLNPIPVYAMTSGILALIVALILRSRPAQITAFVVVIFAALSVWPVGEFGERASDRVYAMSNKEAQQWLDVHRHRADVGEWVFYVTAAVAAVAPPAPLPQRLPSRKTPIPRGRRGACEHPAIAAPPCSTSRTRGRKRARQFSHGPTESAAKITTINAVIWAGRLRRINATTSARIPTPSRRPESDSAAREHTRAA